MKQDDKFIFAPIEIFKDHRLTKRELKTLLSIISFDDRSDSGAIRPKIKSIAKRAGIYLKHVSVPIKGLIDNGWLTKDNSTRPCIYKYHVPKSFSASGKFAKIPRTILIDDSLTKIDINVLSVLYSFKDNNSDQPITVYLKTVAERVGYHTRTISFTAKSLKNKAWLTKTGKGGFSRPSQYALHIPFDLTANSTKPIKVSVTNSDNVSVTKPVNVSSTKPVNVSSTKPVNVRSPKPVNVRSPKPVNVRSPKPVNVRSPKPVKGNITNHTNKPYGLTLLTDMPKPKLNQKALDDFVQHRIDIKKPMTERAKALTIKTLEKHTHEEQQKAVDNSILNGWRGIFPKTAAPHDEILQSFKKQLPNNIAPTTAKGLENNFNNMWRCLSEQFKDDGQQFYDINNYDAGIECWDNLFSYARTTKIKDKQFTWYFYNNNIIDLITGVHE